MRFIRGGNLIGSNWSAYWWVSDWSLMEFIDTFVLISVYMQGSRCLLFDSFVSIHQFCVHNWKVLSGSQSTFREGPQDGNDKWRLRRTLQHLLWTQRIHNASLIKFWHFSSRVNRRPVRCLVETFLHTFSELQRLHSVFIFLGIVYTILDSFPVCDGFHVHRRVREISKRIDELVKTFVSLTTCEIWRTWKGKSHLIEKSQMWKVKSKADQIAFTINRINNSLHFSSWNFFCYFWSRDVVLAQRGNSSPSTTNSQQCSSQQSFHIWSLSSSFIYRIERTWIFNRSAALASAQFLTFCFQFRYQLWHDSTFVKK